MMKYLFPLAILTACLAPNTGWSIIGEPVPALQVKEWVHGNPVDINAGTNIFVVEILNVAGPDGRAIVADLNDVQKRFKTNGVVVVAISDETPEKIRANLGLAAGGITNLEFSVGADNQRQTSVSYLKPAQPANRRVIPYAFVVGTNGNLVWHGMPKRGLVDVLTLVTAGKYDVEREKKFDLAAHQMLQYLAVAREGGDRAVAAGQALLAARTNDVPLLCDMAFRIATTPRLATRDFNLASAALDQAQKIATTNMTPVLLGRAIVLFESGKPDDGLNVATQALASAQSPSERTNILRDISRMNARLATMKSGQGNTNTPAAAPDAAPKP